MEWVRSLMLPQQGSDFAKEVDYVYMGIFWLSVVMFIGIVVAMCYFAWRYRYVPGRVTPHQTHNTTLEILWSVLPLLLCVGLFFWGMKAYMKFIVAPGDAMEVQVTGQKWQWQFEYPDGTRSLNELHVPVNKPVRLVMTSVDVIHDFYVPDMRVKHDVVPGRYTQLWFNPTVLGEHVGTCAEYCGKGHSDMRAKVFVETQADYEKWMATGGTEWEDYKTHMQDWGKIQWDRKGCGTCHTVDGSSSKGPSWKGIWGSQVKVKQSDGKVATVTIDENYIRESIMQPGAKVVDGFENIMPTFQGLLRQNEMDGLVAYIKSLQ
ncbi:MAG: cytochrome c oxidase subunit II [Bryobacteraceae bacterium]